MKFALNHMVAPRLGYEDFFDLAVALGVKGVEIRNDIVTSDLSMAAARRIKDMAAGRGLEIASVNALQRFNEWSTTRAEEAKALAAYAAAVGAHALVMCPVNDTAYRPAHAARLAGLREALHGLAPILSDHGLIGFVEPLGFVECSLRLKSEALAAIDDVGEAARFKLVHDTFHHVVAGEAELFPARTGMVHVSGVSDKTQTIATMRDINRELVDGDDVIDNRGQARALIAGGYIGVFSFEPFAPAIHQDPAIAASLKASMVFLASFIS